MLYNLLPVSARENKLFQGITDEYFQKVGKILQHESHKAGQTLFSEGDHGSCVYLIEKGQVKITKEGRQSLEEVLSIFDPNDFFGEMAVVDNEPRSATAIALTDCELWKIQKKDFEEIIILHYPHIAINMIKTITQRMRSLDKLFIKEMLKSERLGLVGQMAGGIIHDFKNPMAAVRSGAEVLQMSSQDERTKKLTGIIISQVDRMNNMAHEILDFSRGDSHLKTATTNLKDLVDEFAALNEADCEKRKVKLDLLVDDVPMIMADSDRIYRVIQNIAGNGIDAMPGGGTLTIKSIADSNGVDLIIADTGIGMSEEVRQKVFEPFFTHGKKRGTGLGMAITKRIIDAHQGSIRVESEMGKGTRFIIHLPYNPESAPLNTT